VRKKERKAYVRKKERKKGVERRDNKRTRDERKREKERGETTYLFLFRRPFLYLFLFRRPSSSTSCACGNAVMRGVSYFPSFAFSLI